MDVAASTYTRDDDEPFDDEMPSSCDDETQNPVSSLEQAMEEFDEEDLLMNVLCKVLERSKFV